jgi:uncharacterized Zn-finger protein
VTAVQLCSSTMAILRKKILIVLPRALLAVLVGVFLQFFFFFFYRFTQSNSLKAHRLIHTGDKPVFQCELCPTTCGRKTDLRLHVQKLHTSERSLHCKMCGKSFPDRYTLKVHKKTHEGEKCFKCDLCPYSSISQRHLESHMLIHTDQKPFQCDACDQSFRQKQLLKRHQNLYHNPNYVPPPPKVCLKKCFNEIGFVIIFFIYFI